MQKPTIRTAGLSNQLMRLHDGYDLSASPELASQGDARPLSLVDGDFDGDGLSDVVSGYGVGAAGRIVLHRRDANSIFANSAEEVASAFHNEGAVFDAPAAPDFLTAGDFNQDGHLDLIFATRNATRFHLMKGDGRGGFARAETTEVPGSVTALISGEVGRRDGKVDLIVAVNEGGASQALAFAGRKGGLAAQPRNFNLPAEATSIALGRFDEDHLFDLAFTAGRQLIIKKGLNSRTTNPASAEPENEQGDTITFSSPLKSVVSGSLAGDSRAEMVVLTADGIVQSVSHGGGKSQSGKGGEAKWHAEPLTLEQWPQATGILGASVSAAAADDLVLLDNNMHFFTVGKSQYNSIAETRSVTRIDTGTPVVAALSMRLNGDALSDLVVLRADQSAPTVITTAAVSTFGVTNTNDSGPGSLRQALLDANASPGADLIRFSIPGSGVHTIAPASELPAIEEAVTIDGFTQPGSRANSLAIGDDSIHLIELSGANAGPVTAGLTVRGGDTVVRGLVINSFARIGLVGGVGLRLEGPTDNAGNVIEGNFIGTTVNGRDGAANEGSGVQLDAGSAGATIGGARPARNVISGNQGDGVIVGCDDSLITGNYIGVDALGSAGLGNGRNGVLQIGRVNTNVQDNVISSNNFNGITLFGSGCQIALNVIGADATTAHALPQGTGVSISGSDNTVLNNVCSGNSVFGVQIDESTSMGNELDSNKIGTNQAGTEKLPNLIGVIIDGTDTLIHNNVISGNEVIGIVIDGAAARDNVIRRNRIGVTSDVSAPLANGGDGVLLSETTFNVVEDNIIGGNDGDGIAIESSTGVFVKSNFIGTDERGELNLGNAANGIRIAGAGGGHSIGLGALEDGNVIARNGANGILIEESIANSILGNQVFGNGLLGIDLGGDGLSSNDELDGDKGANNLQNFPIMKSATLEGNGETLRFAGSLNSDPNTVFFIEIFLSDPTDGFGEGKRLVSGTNAHTDEEGNAIFFVSMSEGLPVGSLITATATSQAGNTSEFSRAITVTGDTADLSISMSAGSLTEVTGKRVPLTLIVDNLGPDEARDVVVQLADDSVEVKTVAPGGRVLIGDAFLVDCTAADGEVLNVTTSVRSDTFDPDLSNNTATVAITAVNPGPAITCRGDLTIRASAQGQTLVVNYEAPAVTDNCADVQVTCTPPSGSAFPVGTTTVTCTATDSGGATASCSFTVTVVLFDLCIQDDSNGKILRFSSATGDYEFLDCRKGFTLTGKGVVTLQFGSDPCKVRLVDGGSDPKRYDRNVTALVNVCTNVASATVQVFAQGTTHSLNDSNTANNACVCP